MREDFLTRVFILFSTFVLLFFFSGVSGDYELELVVSGLDSPVVFVAAPDGSGDFYVVEQAGMIKKISDGEVFDFLDIRDRIVSDFSNTNFGEFDERGLLGLAFHPDYLENGLFYVYFSADSEDDRFDHKNVVYEMSSFDAGYEKLILENLHPQFNHNAGQLAFGEDGYLYIGIGDGGGANDNYEGHSGGEGTWGTGGSVVGNLGNAQDLGSLNGKILRIDVDNLAGNKRVGNYSIPTDNPFFGREEYREEIFVYGVRNPWKFSFDNEGNLWVADVGQDNYEEVSVVSSELSGANLGWRKFEGSHVFDEEAELTEELPLIYPLIEYGHPGLEEEGILDVGISVVGGYVYDGSASSLRGKYVFGDWSSSFVMGDWSLMAVDLGGNVEVLDVASRGKFLSSFGKDNFGELYVVLTDSATPGVDNGYVYRIVE